MFYYKITKYNKEQKIVEVKDVSLLMRNPNVTPITQNSTIS